MLVRIQQGEDRVKAAKEVVSQAMVPLLGATVIAVAAFAPIGLSDDNTGEYCRSLFVVLLISLMLSWLTAITITPLFCVMFLKGKPADALQNADPYQGAVFQLYRRVLEKCIRFRWVTLSVAVGLLAVSVVCFRFVDKSFFPTSTRRQFMIDIWLPSGTHIDDTEETIRRVEEHLVAEYPDDVEHVTSFIGQGASRFLLTYAPEKPDSAYGQLLVTVKDHGRIDQMGVEIQSWMEENLADAAPNVKKFQLGPSEGGKIQVRLSGRDPGALRALADEAMAVMEADADAAGIRSDWGQRTKVLRPVLSELQARRTGITRPDLAQALEAASAGTTAGVYREGDTLLPIIARSPEAERASVDSVQDVQVYSPVARRTVPIRQVVSRFDSVWEDPVIWRRDRLRTITVHCDPRRGAAGQLLGRVAPRIEALKRRGCLLEWRGEYENSKNGRAGLMASIPGFLLPMVLMVIFLFNSLRQPLIIWLCVPLALIGVTFGLLGSGQIINHFVAIEEANMRTSLPAWPLAMLLVASTAGVFSDCSAQAAQQDQRPNVLLVVLDDMGNSDIGPFGGGQRTAGG